MDEVVDIAGNVIRPGDRIAAAFRSSTNAFLRLGTVLGFGERGNKLTVHVQWDTDSGFGVGPRTITTVGAIQADLRRFVKVDA